MDRFHPNFLVWDELYVIFSSKFKSDGDNLLNRMADMLFESMTADHKNIESRDSIMGPNWSWINRRIRQAVTRTGSPIEALLMCAMMCISDIPVKVVDAKTVEELSESTADDGFGIPSIHCAPQMRIDRFTVDFALAAKSDYDQQKLVIECDGHEFHNNNRLQVAKDNARARLLTAHGFHLMRFSGHEIHKDPEACAREAVSFFRVTVDECLQTCTPKRDIDMMMSAIDILKTENATMRLVRH